jgi:hypothetical protein
MRIILQHLLIIVLNLCRPFLVPRLNIKDKRLGPRDQQISEIVPVNRDFIPIGVLLLGYVTRPSQPTDSDHHFCIHNLHAHTIAAAIAKEVVVDDGGVFSQGFFVCGEGGIEEAGWVKFFGVGVDFFIAGVRPVRRGGWLVSLRQSQIVRRA